MLIQLIGSPRDGMKQSLIKLNKNIPDINSIKNIPNDSNIAVPSISNKEKIFYKFLVRTIENEKLLTGVKANKWLQSLHIDRNAEMEGIQRGYNIVDLRSKTSETIGGIFGVVKQQIEKGKKAYKDAIAGYGEDFGNQQSRLEFLKIQRVNSPFKRDESGSKVYDPESYNKTSHERGYTIKLDTSNPSSSINQIHLQVYILLCLRRFGEFDNKIDGFEDAYKAHETKKTEEYNGPTQFDLFFKGWNPADKGGVGNKYGIIDNNLQNDGGISLAIALILKAGYKSKRGPYSLENVRNAHRDSIFTQLPASGGSSGNVIAFYKQFAESLKKYYKDVENPPIGYFLGEGGGIGIGNIVAFIHDLYHGLAPGESGSNSHAKFDKRPMSKIKKELLGIEEQYIMTGKAVISESMFRKLVTIMVRDIK